jgi:class 3 adenylate cyclase
LASEEVYKQLPQWPAVVQEPLQLKGFDAPVIAYELGREDS